MKCSMDRIAQVFVFRRPLLPKFATTIERYGGEIFPLINIRRLEKKNNEEVIDSKLCRDRTVARWLGSPDPYFNFCSGYSAVSIVKMGDVLLCFF